MLDAALEYATTHSWPVFPCRPGGKSPAIRTGFKAATLDPDRIRSWWANRPDLNVGIATGPAGLLVVDLDYKPEQDVNGLARWWELLEDAQAAHPATLCAVTPSGGWHLYFRLAAGGGIGNSASKLAVGIDIRCEGGYVVAPPSVTPAGQYEWDHIWHDDVLDAPAWLIDRLIVKPAPRFPALPTAEGGGTAYGMAALKRQLGDLAVAAEGTRNDSLVRAACSLGRLVAGGQLDAGHATSQLITVALRIGLTEHEAVATIRSGLETGMQSPKAPNR